MPFEIIEKSQIVPTIHNMIISAPRIARKARAGQFIILRIDDAGERIPLTIADFDREKGTITTIFQEIGKTTAQLSEMNAGECLLDFVGPLGKPSEIEQVGTVVCVGGGVGVAPVYPIARAHKEVLLLLNLEYFYKEDFLRIILGYCIYLLLNSF